MIRQRRAPTPAPEACLPSCDVLYEFACVRVLHVRARVRLTHHHTHLSACSATLSRGPKIVT